MAVLPTPDDKYMVFWMEDACVASLIYRSLSRVIQRLAGTLMELSSSGTSDSRHLQVKVVDDERGLLAIWIQDEFSDIYAQLIDWDGIHYGNRGVYPFQRQIMIRSMFLLNSIVKNTCFLVWQDYRNGTDFEIYGEVVDLDSGNLREATIQFSVDTTDQYNPSLASLQE